MAYCVRCGVELDEAAKKCALCGTQVIDPDAFKCVADDAAPAFSQDLVLPPSVRRRYLAFIISMVILIPNIVSAIINLLFPSSGIWAVYVVSTSALVWVLFVQPFLWHKRNLYYFIATDGLAIAAFVFVFQLLDKNKSWFLSLALPLIVLLEITVLITAYWLKRAKRDWPETVNVVLAQIGVYSLFVDLLLHRYLQKTFNLSFSLVVIACCLALVAFFLAVKRNRRLRTWLSRKFFV
ncbi:MAG TPA: DUF6320 domain-containing protein [Clostridiales bacterium]|nr:DUF6320 domain-containing protein [Clostridiales bacterium]HRT82307.1 DUF6320 domain-containing protein [Oscillospiraceae bacterium]